MNGHESGISQCEDEATMADIVSVHHVGPNFHACLGVADFAHADFDTKRMQRQIIPVHFFPALDRNAYIVHRLSIT